MTTLFELGRVSLTKGRRIRSDTSSPFLHSQRVSTRLTGIVTEHQIPPISHISGALPPVAPKSVTEMVTFKENYLQPVSGLALVHSRDGSSSG